jgi:A/G-specific adenine glycosylase
LRIRQPDAPALRARLLDWYRANARTLPWRAPPGSDSCADPYRVWLSEIMLQQTTVAAVIPYFERFLAAFPTVEALAQAPREQVLGLWAGLGYYARARNLHACAQAVAARGGFAHTAAELQTLPGIGPYTAAAIAAIAFGEAIVPADGNVERVLSRLWRIEDALPAARPLFRTRAQDFAAPDGAADLAQALMELGATVCTPRSPKCGVCPWESACAARAAGDPERFPVKAAKPERPVRSGVCFALFDPAGRVLVRSRPDKGLLGGMTELPSTPWRVGPWTRGEALAHAPAQADWRLAGSVAHVFTHFALELDVLAAAGPHPPGVGRSIAPDALGAAALPTVFAKAVARALAGRG